MADEDDQNPLIAPRARMPILRPIDDPRARETARVDDPEQLDTEDRRRMANLERRVLQRRGRRDRYMAAIREADPALFDELAALRRLSPQAFRKRLQHEVRRLELHGYLQHGPRASAEPPPEPPEPPPEPPPVTRARSRKKASND
ncbi:MAG: hypothetical protein ABMA64_01875 [Myxococcota bacterium]